MYVQVQALDAAGEGANSGCTVHLDWSGEREAWSQSEGGLAAVLGCTPPQEHSAQTIWIEAHSATSILSFPFNPWGLSHSTTSDDTTAF